MRMRTIVGLCGLCLPCGTAAGEDWAGWRGPRADGTVADSGYPLTWTTTENVRWKAEIPGTGHSSPVVSRGRVFVTACVEAERKRVLYCVDRATGTVLWERCVLVADLEKKHAQNSWASSTVAADGERVRTVAGGPRGEVVLRRRQGRGELLGREDGQTVRSSERRTMNRLGFNSVCCPIRVSSVFIRGSLPICPAAGGALSWLRPVVRRPPCPWPTCSRRSPGGTSRSPRTRT